MMPIPAKIGAKAMQGTHPATISRNQVMALFADRALSFSLPRDATLAELADRLDLMDEWHTGTPTAIYLKFAAASQSVAVIPRRI
jgi:hypothetical protein